MIVRQTSSQPQLDPNHRPLVQLRQVPVNQRAHLIVRVEKQPVHELSELSADPDGGNLVLRNDGKQPVGFERGSIESNVDMMDRDVRIVGVTRVQVVFQAMQIAVVEKAVKMRDAHEVVARDSTLW